MQKIIVYLVVAIGLVVVIFALTRPTTPSSNNPNYPSNNINCSSGQCGPAKQGPDDPNYPQNYDPVDHGDVPAG